MASAPITQIDTEPNVLLMELLRSEWVSTNVDGPFETRWIHTGDYDDSNPHPEITLEVETENHRPDGMDPGGGGSTAWVGGSCECRLWVPNDRDQTNSNPKQYIWQLQKEVQRIIKPNMTVADRGDPALRNVYIGQTSRVNETDRSPTLLGRRIPIRYTWFKGRQ